MVADLAAVGVAPFRTAASGLGGLCERRKLVFPLALRQYAIFRAYGAADETAELAK